MELDLRLQAAAQQFLQLWYTVYKSTAASQDSAGRQAYRMAKEFLLDSGVPDSEIEAYLNTEEAASRLVQGYYD
jgi:hypothetical protein